MDDINNLDISLITQELNEKIGFFWAANGLPFDQVESPYFLDLVETLRSINPTKLKYYKPPTRQTMSSSVIPRIHKIVDNVKKKLLKDTDSVILCDGWKNKSNNTKQFVFTLRNTKVPQLFLCSYNVSKESEYATDLALNINNAIKYAKREYDTEVTGIQTDNDAKIQAGARLAKNSKNEPLMQTTCSSHSGNRLVKTIAEDSVVLSQRVKKIIGAFSTPKHTDLIRRFGGTKLEDWPDTRFCYFRDSCQSILKNREVLRKIFMIEDINISDEIGELLESAEFYQELKSMVETLDPICKLINKCQSPSESIADAVDQWLNLALPTDKYNKAIQERITHAVTAVGWAAYFMDPRYKGQKLNDLQQSIAVDFLRNRLDEEGTVQLQDFLENRNEASLHWDEISKDSYAFWQQHKYIYPQLSTLCLQLMIIPASTALIEGFFSHWAYVHNKYRNRLSQETSSLLVDLYYMSKHWKNGVWYDRSKKRKRIGASE